MRISICGQLYNSDRWDAGRLGVIPGDDGRRGESLSVNVLGDAGDGDGESPPDLSAAYI